MQKVIEETERLSISDRVALEKQMSIPVRPGTGSIGKGIRLYANYFQVCGWMDDDTPGLSFFLGHRPASW